MSPCWSHFYSHSNLQNCHKEHAVCIYIDDLLTKMTMFHHPRLAIAVTKLTVTHFHEPQWQPHTGLSEKNKKKKHVGDKNSNIIWHRAKTTTDSTNPQTAVAFGIGIGPEAETTSPRCLWPVDSSRSPGNHPELPLSAWGWASKNI